MANIWWTMMIYSTLFEVYDDAIFMLYLTLQRRNILRASCNIRIHFKMHELLSSTLFPNTKVLTKVSVTLEAKKKVYDSKKILSRSRTKLNEINQICSLLTRFCSSKLCSNKMILFHIIYTITFTWGMKFFMIHTLTLDLIVKLLK